MDSVTVIIDHWLRKRIDNATGVTIQIAGPAWKEKWMHQHLRQLLEQGISSEKWLNQDT